MANKPNIRFKGFKDDWEQRKFQWLVDESIIDIPMDGNHGEKHPTVADYVESGIPFLMASDIHNGSVDLRKCKFISEERASKLDKGFAKNGDVLITHKATIGEVAILKDLQTPYAVLTPQVTYYRIKDNNRLEKKYLYAWFNSDVFQNEIKSKAAQSTRAYIGISAQRELTIQMPSSIDEQEAVGNLIYNLDNLITLYQRKCDSLKQVKKYMLQKMFPKQGEKVPEIRFEGFTDDWEQRRLGDIVSFSKGTGYSKADLQDSGTPIILYGRLYTKYETVISEVDTFADEKTNSVFSNGGEVIVPASGETAEDISVASVVEQSGVILGGDLNIITPPQELDSAFLAISISNGKPHSDMAKMAQGKSVVHLHNSDLAKINLPYPSYEEQRRISSHFKSIDTLITLHQNKSDSLKQVKKYMLQNMFPKQKS